MFPIAMWNVHDRVLYDQVRACKLLLKKSDTTSYKYAGKSATYLWKPIYSKEVTIES